MDLSIYSPELKLLGVADEFSSLIWHRRFFKAGYFKLSAPALKNNISLLRKHNLIEKPESDEIGFITSVKITYDSEKGGTVDVSGCFLSGLLSRRIITDAGESDGLLEIIDKQCGSACSEPIRQIPSLMIDKTVPVNYFYTEGIKFYNLAEFCTAVCMQELCGICIKLVHGSNENYLLLTVRYGVDRSVEQTENPQVVFSEEFDNLLSAEYSYSEDNSINTVYGYSTVSPGVDDKPAPPEYLTGAENSGFNRLEASVSVKAVIETYTAMKFIGYGAEGNPMYETEQRKRVKVADTLKLLKLECEKGKREIAENVSGDVKLELGYKKDYELGDIVTIYQENWNVTLNRRIYEVTEYYDSNGRIVQPVFGNPLRTIADFIK